MPRLELFRNRFATQLSPGWCLCKKEGSSSGQISATQRSLLLTAYQLLHNAEKLRYPYVGPLARHYNQAAGLDHTARLAARAVHDGQHRVV